MSDVYLEKIYYTKLYRDQPQEIERLGIGRGNAHDVTANQKVRFKVKCVGLEFDLVSNWLVQEETRSNMRALLDFVSQQGGVESQREKASQFVKDLRSRLAESKCDKLLMRLVNEKL